MKKGARASLLTATLVLTVGHAQAAQFLETFDEHLPSPFWSLDESTGYAVEFFGGSAAFTKVRNSPDGHAALSTAFVIDGDFTIRVDVDGRSSGPLYEGLSLSWLGSTAFAQIFRQTAQSLQAMGPSATQYNWNLRSFSNRAGTFQISRVGQSVALAVDRGDGVFNTYLGYTNAVYAGPVTAHLIAVDVDPGPNGNGDGVSYFDNFSVQADYISPVPEPEVAALMLAGLAAVRLWVARGGHSRCASAVS